MAGQINKNKLLLVEGVDEINFFYSLFKSMNISDIQVIESKGKERFPAELELIVNDPEFEKVSGIGIVRDADNDQTAAVQSIQYYLKKHELPHRAGHGGFDSSSQIRVGIFIAPGFKENGMLESLVLESLTQHPVKMAAERYLADLKSSLANQTTEVKFNYPNNEPKALMHAFLAGMEKFIPSLGLASKKGYFDLEAEVFQDIRSFISLI